MGWSKSTSSRLSTYQPARSQAAQKHDFVQHRLEDPFVNGMNQRSGRIAASLLFISAALICSLATGQGTARTGTRSRANASVFPSGNSEPVCRLLPCVSLGSAPVITPYGGLTFNTTIRTRFIGGGANESTGRIYQIELVVTPVGTSSALPAGQVISDFSIENWSNNDAGVAFDRRMFFVTRFLLISSSKPYWAASPLLNSPISVPLV